MKQLIKQAVELASITNTNVTITLNERQATMLMKILTCASLPFADRDLAKQFLLEEVEAT